MIENLIQNTSYQNKNYVKQVCHELTTAYEHLTVSNVVNPGRQQARVLEVHGTIPITFKGRVYHIMASFIFPPFFPNAPPMVHLINPDYSDEALEIAKKLEKDLNLQRNHMVELQNLWLKLQDEELKLHKFEETAPVIMSDLEDKIEGIGSIIKLNQNTALNSETLKTAIEETDEGSKLLMDLITTNKSIEDLQLFAEEMFIARKIDMESYMKLCKDNFEREFMNSVWIRKIISQKK